MPLATTSTIAEAVNIPLSTSTSWLNEAAGDVWRLRYLTQEQIRSQPHPGRLESLIALLNILAEPQQRRTPATILNIFDIFQPVANDPRESAWVITTDAKLPWPGQSPAPGITNIHKIAVGTPGTVSFTPADVFRPAIVDNAAGIIIVHTHTHDDHTATASDIAVTNELIELANKMGIRLLDSVIVSRQGATSMFDDGIAEFTR